MPCRLTSRRPTGHGGGCISGIQSHATLRIAETSARRPFVSVARGRRDNLPAEISSFIGRASEIAEIVQLVGTHRLVTLSGAPGVGKTRLALRVAGELRDTFSGGVWFVELASLAEPALVPSTLAAVLGLRVDEHQPPSQTIREHLRAEQILLVLDNCEHLTDACAELVDLLLQACPGLQILATSREPLGLSGEICWSVPPLRVPLPTMLASSASSARGVPSQAPSVAVVVASEAGQLFLDRARAVRRTLTLSEESATAIVQICRRLDGIPLAIELAAARVIALSPGEIAARLDDRFTLLARAGRAPLPRQRTLRESVDWSYELLTEHERTLLRRLSIFRGGWTLEDVEAVCDGAPSGEAHGANDPRDPVSSVSHHPSLAVLFGLVEKSLVVVEERDGGTRYRLLETLRQYAWERLHEAGEEVTLARQHWSWCVDLSERASTYLRTPHQAAWRARLEVEHDNLRAALSRTVEYGDAEPGLRLCVALWHFWIDRGYANEGYGWLRRLLALDSATPRTILRAAGLFVAGKLAFEGADIGTAQDLCEESLAISREVDDPHSLHRTLTQLGHIARGRGDLLAARQYYEEALPLRRELGEPVDVAVSLACLGHVARALHEYDHAQALYEESLELAEKQGHPAEITAAQHDLGRLAHERGNDDEAASWFAEALIVAQRIKHPRRMAYLLEGFAVLAARDQPERALRLAGAAAALRRSNGSILSPNDQAALERDLAPARRLLNDGRRRSAWEDGAALSVDEAVALALTRVLPSGATAPPQLESPASAPHSTQPDTTTATEADDVAAGGSAEHLTTREREVVALVARGLSNRQIADELVVSERTAEWHVANSLSKLGLSSRAQLAVWAARHGQSSDASTSTRS
jgi:predicted ATPase/DNA-binding CsgD family transcriptional regulator